MIGGKTQGSQRPTALGTMLQASTYGMTIPTIYGTTRAALLAIWAQNLRKGNSDKKGKKKGVSTYVENIDFLLGANPLECVLQTWANSTKFPLNFKTYRVAPGAGVKTVTIPDPDFYKLIAVTAEVALVSPITFNCFGAPGPITFTGGGGNTLTAAQIAASPQFVPGNDSYVTLEPQVTIPGVGAAEWVFGRIRGAGLSVWQDPPAGMIFMLSLTSGCMVPGTASPFMTIGEIIGHCNCGVNIPVPGLTVITGICGPSGTGGDGSGQSAGNIQTLPTGGFQYDMEALGFTIGNKNGFDIGAPCIWSGSGPIGPCDGGLGGPVFPGPGTPPLFLDGHNMSDAAGGQIFMFRANPVDPTTGVPLYVAVIAGATGSTLGSGIPAAAGWTLAQQGTLIQVFYAYGTPPTSTSIPLWNAAQHGPDLINPNYVRQSNYKWDPNADGATIEILDVQSANPPGSPLWTWNGFLTFYYAALSDVISGQTPLHKLRLTFEPQLGDGPEYTTHGNFTNQQLIYPEFAGVGSAELDLGASAAMPSIRAEVKGTFAKIPPRGDAEFADMIEDIIKSGTLQLGAQLGLIQRGVNANELPGPVQKNFIQYNPAAAINLPFRSANAAGDMLIAFARTGAATPTIADTAPNAWTPIVAAGDMGFWYTAGGAVAADAGNVVSFGNALEGYIIEMDPGSTAVDGGAPRSFTGTGPGAITGTITTTTADGVTYILGLLIDDSGTFGPLPAHWNQNLFPRANVASGKAFSAAFYRIVSAPGTYTIKIPRTGSGNWTLILIPFVAAQPVPYPKTLGKIIDEPTLQNVRDQDMANGLWGSLYMDSQQDAGEWLKQLYQCANADPMWSGFTLKSVARSEVPMVANGAVYTPPTCAGPVILHESDLVGSTDKSPVVIARKAQVDANNIIQAQFFDRNADYNQSTAGEPLSGATALYGPRKESPTNLPEIQDPLVARMVLDIAARRYALLRNVYKFAVKSNHLDLEAGDLVALNDSFLGLVNLGVRLTKVKENDDRTLECEADLFVYGANAPVSLPATAIAQPAPSPAGADPGSVNPPIIFEPVPRLFAQQSQGQVWAVVSGSSPNYGGNLVLISTDGGASYNPVGQVNGNPVMGATNVDWPAASDPDTTNDLILNTIESNGTVATIPTSDEDNFLLPFIVGGGLACIPYELGAYAVANLVGVNQYQLKATGGGTNHLRRAVFGAPQVGTGVDHPAGSPFAILNPNGVGIFKINLDPTWVGTTIYFKFLAFNTQGGATQAEADAIPYPFTPTGCPSNTSTSGVGNNTVAVPIAPVAAGNFTVAHGLGVAPKFATVQMTSGGRVWFQAGLRYDAINLYLTASDAGVTGNIICWAVAADAEVALAPGAFGNFTVPHGLGVVPALVLIQMTSGGAIWLQTPAADATNLFLTASDSLTGFAEVFKPTAQATKVIFGEITAAPTAPGTFAIPHNLGVIPKLALVRETSGGDVWFQAVRYDITNVYLVASDADVTALIDVWG